MARRRAYDYGSCHVCGSAMVEKEVAQDLWVRGKLVVIEDVPAGVCTQCGERVVKAEVGRGLAAIVDRSTRPRPARTLRVPVIKYGKVA
jgi:YgiT-type zinc finger domain-containing protein